MPEQQANSPISIFYSYAQEDKLLQEKLSKHLSGLRRQGVITEWHHGNIPAGTDWQHTIDTHFATATIILLLISPDFMAADDCYREMQRALEQNEAGISHVISILLRPINLVKHPITKLKTLPQNERPVTRWENEDAAFEDIVSGINQIIEQIHSVTVSHPSIHNQSSQATSQQLFIVPYRRNLRFTDREEILNYLHQRLKTDRVALTQAQAISGLGGIGKTQTALEYAYRYTHTYQSILWINASSVETLLTDFAGIAARLQLPEYDAQDQRTAIRAVGKWLERNSGWLLILDNADDLTTIYDALPTNSHTNGQILFTTRAQAVGPDIEAIEVTKMDKPDGIQLFLTRAKKLRSGEALTSIPPQMLKEADAIVTELDGLPLAIDQAGAFIDETGCSLANYLELYKTHRKSLLSWKSRYSSTYPMTVATTWSLAFQRIEQENPDAIALLQFFAFLAPDAIPEEIITEGATHISHVLEPIASDVFKLNEAIEILRRYSLIRRNAEAKTLTIHRMTQAVIQDSMVVDEQRQWAEAVVEAVHRTFGFKIYENLSHFQRYLPHIYVSIKLVEKYNIESFLAAILLSRAAHYMQNYIEDVEFIENLYQRVLNINKNLPGDRNLHIAASQCNIGVLYYEQKRYEEAEQLCMQALTIFEKIPEEEPHYIINYLPAALELLALLYRQQKRYQEAMVLYQRTWDIYEKIAGSGEPDSAIPLQNMALLHEDQGNDEEAEKLYRQALDIYKNAPDMSVEPFNVAITQNNLALLYWRKQERYQEAEELFRSVLHIRERALGLQHSDTIKTFGHLAELLRETGRAEEADALEARLSDAQVSEDEPPDHPPST